MIWRCEWKVVLLPPICAKEKSNMRENRLDRIVLDELKAGRYEFEFVLDSAYFQSIERTELLSGNVDVHARLNIRQQDYDVRLRMKGHVEVTCDRCLEPMTIAVEYHDVVDTELEAKTLDLLWTAYETIVINLPMVHCHPDGECSPEMAALLQSHLSRVTEEPEE